MGDNVALSRIQKLLDDGSFVEIGAEVTARMTDFTLRPQAEASDGVITGYGQIEGYPVFVYSQNRAVLNGTMGEMHAKKIMALYDKAAYRNSPVIGMLDCGGFRLQESVDALDAFGALLNKQMEASGAVLQISAVFGGCAGGMTMIPALSDFSFMAKGAQMFVNAPHTITDNPAMARDFDAAAFQNEVSGRVEVLESEDAVIEKIRRLVLLLEDDTYGACDEAELNRYVASGKTVENADVRALLRECADKCTFEEIRPDYCPEMVTGLLKLNGITVGAVGTAHAIYEEDGSVSKELPRGLTAGGCGKAAEFLEFCKRASMPVLRVLSAEGFAPLAENERALPAALANLARALAGSTEPYVNLIIGDTYGSAYTALAIKSVWDAPCMTFAWDGVKVGMMEAEKAANILFADDAAKGRQAAAYEAKQNSVRSVAARGSVDAVIEPKETRKHLIAAFSML